MMLPPAARALLGGPQQSNGGSVQKSYKLTIAADISVSNFAWVPITLGFDTASKVAFNISSQGYGGKVKATIYQSSDGTKRDAELASAVMTVQSNTTTPEQMTITKPPERGSNPFSPNVPNYLIVDVEPVKAFKETNKANNAATLKVAEPDALSVELEGKTPLANTRTDRVALWLAANRALIQTYASVYKVPASAIAGAIAWEALYNVATIKTYQGPGKVHPISNQLGVPSAAQQVETLALEDKLSPFGLTMAVQTNAGAVSYIAAILDSYALGAEKAGSKANIRNNPGVLDTFYNGVAKTAPTRRSAPSTITAFQAARPGFSP